MRVYVRKWNGTIYEQQPEAVLVDSYNGLCFCKRGRECPQGPQTHIPNTTRVQVYEHAGKRNALVVYVEADEGGGE